MAIPKRLRNQAGRHARVDGIPFEMPVIGEHSQALMAVFPINAERARKLLAGTEIHPFRLWNRGLLVITVVNYRHTVIGKYIEFSIAIACTHGPRPAPRLIPALLMKRFGTGQFVYDLPVSTEISVKGGKGIWGMPKHQASLDYLVGEKIVSSQYDLDGQLAVRIDIERPKKAWLPMSVGAVNYCQFRGMLMKSYIYFRGKMGFSFRKKGSARLMIGEHPRVRALKDLQINSDPLFTCFLPDTYGVLDDHMEAWFLHSDRPPLPPPEGLESTVHLGLGQEWPAPPKAAGREEQAKELLSGTGS